MLYTWSNCYWASSLCHFDTTSHIECAHCYGLVSDKYEITVSKGSKSQLEPLTC